MKNLLLKHNFFLLKHENETKKKKDKEKLDRKKGETYEEK
jgi:hypothetical protein